MCREVIAQLSTSIVKKGGGGAQPVSQINTQIWETKEMKGMKEEARFENHRFFKGKWWDTVRLTVVLSDWKKA